MKAGDRRLELENVLIVDDDPDSVHILAEIVRKAGYAVFSCDAAAAGIKHVQEHEFFLIFSDLIMPGMDGIEFCRQVRPKNPDVPFVLVTARADRDRAIESLRSGISEIVDKPFHPETIRNVLRHFAHKRQENLLEEEKQSGVLLATFLEEARELMLGVDESLLKLEEEESYKSEIDRLFRKIHTIKGSSGATKKAAVLTPLAHAIESLLSRLKEQLNKPKGAVIDALLQATDLLSQQIRSIEQRGDFPDGAETINLLQKLTKGDSSGVPSKPRVVEKAEVRGEQDFDSGVFVPTDKLDSFMEMAGELIAVKNDFYMFYREPGYLSDAAMVSAKEVGQTLDKLSERIQTQLMEVRRVDMKKVFAKLPRIVRQVCAELGKEAVLDISGEDVSVDKSIANVLSGCLSHAVRNALDHGLESGEERQRLGKGLKGRISIRAENLSDAIRVTIADDGHGIHRQKVLAKAISRQLVTAAEGEKMSDHDVIQLVFQPGFSTAEQVTSISGRGVGMDAIQTAIQGCHGTTILETVAGQGTTLTLTIPVLKTINVERSILLEATGALYAVPLKSVSSIHTLNAADITPLKNHLSFQFRGKATRVASYPELCLSTGIRPSKEAFDERMVVVISSKHQQLGLTVDRLLGQFDAVIRPFNRLVGSLRGFEGTALVGNGRIAYVVEPNAMIALASDSHKEAA